MVGHNSKAGKIVRYILTTLLMLIMIYPFIYLVLNSFAAWDQVDKKLIPTEFTTRSWDWLFGNSVVAAPAPWIHAFINTIIVSTIATGLMLLFGLMVGYALAKVDFKGKKLLTMRFISNVFPGNHLADSAVFNDYGFWIIGYLCGNDYPNDA